MRSESTERLAVVTGIARRYRLVSLDTLVRACEALAAEAPVDVAVLGRFKSGKSSLLNAILGEPVFPVGAVPVTAVVTRAAAGKETRVRVTFSDGSAEEIVPARLAEFVTESGNPDNRRSVAAADVFTPAMARWPGVRLVDTPGLGRAEAVVGRLAVQQIRREHRLGLRAEIDPAVLLPVLDLVSVRGVLPDLAPPVHVAGPQHADLSRPGARQQLQRHHVPHNGGELRQRCLHVLGRDRPHLRRLGGVGAALFEPLERGELLVDLGRDELLRHAPLERPLEVVDLAVDPGSG